MAVNFRASARKVWQTAASIKTGVVLLILVVIFLPKGITSLLRKGYDYLREDTSKTKKVKPDGKT